MLKGRLKTFKTGFQTAFFIQSDFLPSSPCGETVKTTQSNHDILRLPRRKTVDVFQQNGKQPMPCFLAAPGHMRRND